MLASRPRTAISGNRVSIYSNEPLKDLLKDAKRDVIRTKKTAQRSKSAGCLPCQQFTGTNTNHKRFSTVEQGNIERVDIKSWLSERSARNIQEKTEFESSSVRNLYSSLLDHEDEINEELDDYLADNEELHRRKKYLLRKEWTENVYNPLKNEIDKEVNSERYKVFDRTKRNLYSQYLNYSNKKGNVFLDTMSCDEYDPLMLHGHRPFPLKVVFKKSNDPLVHQFTKRNEEDKILLTCKTGLQYSDSEIERSRLPPLPLVPLGRHGTEGKDWLAMELHDIHSDVRQRSQ
eukprot:gene427-1068_t